jgi:hypothetical protein
MSFSVANASIPSVSPSRIASSILSTPWPLAFVSSSSLKLTRGFYGLYPARRLILCFSLAVYSTTAALLELAFCPPEIPVAPDIEDAVSSSLPWILPLKIYISLFNFSRHSKKYFEFVWSDYMHISNSSLNSEELIGLLSLRLKIK